MKNRLIHTIVVFPRIINRNSKDQFVDGEVLFVETRRIVSHEFEKLLVQVRMVVERETLQNSIQIFIRNLDVIFHRGIEADHGGIFFWRDTDVFLKPSRQVSVARERFIGYFVHADEALTSLNGVQCPNDEWRSCRLPDKSQEVIVNQPDAVVGADVVTPHLLV